MTTFSVQKVSDENTVEPRYDIYLDRSFYSGNLTLFGKNKTINNFIKKGYTSENLPSCDK
jgi:hypothetical protein